MQDGKRSTAVRDLIRVLTGKSPVARGIADATTSIEDGSNKIAGGIKRAGEGK